MLHKKFIFCKIQARTVYFLFSLIFYFPLFPLFPYFPMTPDFSLVLNRSAYSFSANHFITFDNGACEPLHGHDFQLSVRVWGANNASGYVLDFLELEKVLRQIISVWDHKTLLPRQNPFLQIQEIQEQIEIKYYQPGQNLSWSLPVEHCCLLDIVNTTTELLAQELAERLAPFLGRYPTIQSWEVALTEAPGCTACCRYQPEP